MLYTGAARVDAVKLGPMNMKGGGLNIAARRPPRRMVFLSASRFTPIWRTCWQTVRQIVPSLQPPTARAVRPMALATLCGNGATRRACLSVPRMVCAKPAHAAWQTQGQPRMTLWLSQGIKPWPKCSDTPKQRCTNGWQILPMQSCFPDQIGNRPW